MCGGLCVVGCVWWVVGSYVCTHTCACAHTYLPGAVSLRWYVDNYAEGTL